MVPRPKRQVMTAPLDILGLQENCKEYLQLLPIPLDKLPGTGKLMTKGSNSRVQTNMQTKLNKNY